MYNQHKPMQPAFIAYRGFGELPAWWSTSEVISNWKRGLAYHAEWNPQGKSDPISGARFAIRAKAALAQLGYDIVPAYEGNVSWGMDGKRALSAWLAATGRPAMTSTQGAIPSKAQLENLGADLETNMVSGPSAPKFYNVVDTPSGAEATLIQQPAPPRPGPGPGPRPGPAKVEPEKTATANVWLYGGLAVVAIAAIAVFAKKKPVTATPNKAKRRRRARWYVDHKGSACFPPRRR